MFGPGDGLAILGMVLSLLLVLSIGGFILLFPVTKRLGGALDQWVRLKRTEGLSESEVAQLGADVQEGHRLLESISNRIDGLEERQDFVETLIEQKEMTALPSSAEG